MPATVFGGGVDPPVGAVAIWADSIASIPAGWALCDGNNGTPNMLDTFAYNGPIVSMSSNHDGGSHFISLTTSEMPSHDHPASTNTTGGHSHEYPMSNDARHASPYADGPGIESSGNYYSTTDGAHSHSVSVGSSGSGASIDNRPPYYEVAFIQKL